MDANERWFRMNLLRHTGFMVPDDVADAVVTAVTVRHGHQYSFMEVTPTAPMGPLPTTYEEWGVGWPSGSRRNSSLSVHTKGWPRTSSGIFASARAHSASVPSSPGITIDTPGRLEISHRPSGRRRRSRGPSGSVGRVDAELVVDGVADATFRARIASFLVLVQ